MTCRERTGLSRHERMALSKALDAWLRILVGRQENPPQSRWTRWPKPPTPVFDRQAAEDRHNEVIYL